jgi:hypothetical protein
VRVEGSADMKPKMDVDISKLMRALKNIDLTADDLLEIGYAGSAVIQANQRIDVPKDSHETELSILPRIVTSQRTHLELDIGPATEYAPVIEYGRSDMPNYPIQPFVRPSARGQSKIDTLKAIGSALGYKVVSKWRK